MVHELAAGTGPETVRTVTPRSQARTSSARSGKPLLAEYGTGETIGRLQEDRESPEPDRNNFNLGR